MKNVNAFKNLIVSDVLSGDCKMIVNGFVTKRVSEKEIVVDMTDRAGEHYDTNYFRFEDLQEVSLMDDKTKFRCVFTNRYLPHRPDVLEIEIMKVVNFKGWIFDTDED